MVALAYMPHQFGYKMAPTTVTHQFAREGIGLVRKALMVDTDVEAKGTQLLHAEKSCDLPTKGGHLRIGQTSKGG